MRRALLVALAACSSPPITGAISAHVTHYDFAFDLDSRVAHATVTATVDTAGNCWTLPYRSGTPTAVAVDGADADSVTVGSASLTACGGGVAAGDQLVLDVDATFPLATLGDSQVGYSITMDAQQNPFYYLVSWVGGCDQFTPCDAAPNVFATYHFDVTHDASLTARCPGTVVDVSPTETTCDFEFDGGPTYSTFSVAAYPAWTTTDEGAWGDSGVHVTVYDRAQTGIAAEIDPAYHSGFISFMEQTFGPFPYGDELRVLTAPTYWNGFETPTNIVLADTLATQTDSGYTDNVAHVLDHEMAHMWAGDQTTLAGTYDFAWKEAMAEYLAFVWEDMNDPDVALTTAGAWRSFGFGAQYYAVPSDDPRPSLFDYYGDVYGPGPMILFRQVEVMSSRAAVIAALQSLLGTPHAISVDDVIAALEQQTGLDLTSYAQAWLEGSGRPIWPEFDLTFTAGSGATSTLVIDDVNAATPYKGCQFQVTLAGADGEIAYVPVDSFHGGPSQTLSVPTPAFTVATMRVDDQHQCMAFMHTPVVQLAERRNPWVSPHGASPAH